ncbi:MAG: hypothetical protein EBY04_01860, partial [Actinobacteria bacterium]|nr:hypothetical protein [Actinomycetota bacterium]
FGDSLLNTRTRATCRCTPLPLFGLPVTQATTSGGAFGGMVMVGAALGLPLDSRLVAFVRGQ